MSFENIQLPDFLIADLYKDCLVELDDLKSSNALSLTQSFNQDTQEEVVAIKQPIAFLGENKQHIIVLVEDEETTILNHADLQFLTNVLKACHLTMGDIAIVNVQQQAITYTQLSEELKARVVLLFQVQPSVIHLPFSIPDFQPQPYAGVTYLKAPALKEINLPTAEARLLKTSLWTNLQKIFSLKP